MARAALAPSPPAFPARFSRLRSRRSPLAPRATSSPAVTPGPRPPPAPATWGDDNRLRFTPDPSVTRKVAPPGAPPVVILPGFGNDANDYVAPFGDADASLKASLERRGWRVHVVDLERKDWARILRGVFSRGFYSGDGTTEPGYTWYLERVDAAVREALEAEGPGGATQVDLVAHSAGGWLARAFVGGALNEVAYEKPFRYWAPREGQSTRAAPKHAVPHPSVRTIVTLGAPHRVAEGPNANDATRGALKWVDERWPGATFARGDGVGVGGGGGGGVVGYCCVSGRTVRGVASRDAKGTLAGYSAGSYAQVCGEGDGVEGDAVVPNAYAFLEGAENIVVDGCFHSMSRVGTYDEDSGEVWYGSEEVVDVWLGALLR